MTHREPSPQGSLTLQAPANYQSPQSGSNWEPDPYTSRREK